MQPRSEGHRAGAALLLAVLLVACVRWAPISAASPAQISTNARASVDDDDLGWGESTTVRGSGFGANAPIRVILYAGGKVLADQRANADGTFAFTITAPSSIGSSNKYRLAVQGVAGDGAFGYVEVPLTIRGPVPTIAISDTDLSWGEVATVTGDRYNEGSKVTVSLFPENRMLAETTAGPGNSFSVDVQIPDKLFSSKDYQVVVTGQGIDLLFHLDLLQVTIVGDRPVIDIARVTVARGETVGVRGELFLPDTEATVTLLPGFEKLAVVPIGADGTFATTIKIPLDAFAKDPHQAVVTGQGADGIFAYDSRPLRIDGDGPGTGSTVATLPSGDPNAHPKFDRFVDRYLGGLPPAPRRGRTAVPAWVVLLLTLLLLLVLLLTSRRRRRR